MRSSVSGVAVDTLLFSHIGVPLFHRYQVFGRPGTHIAFCRYQFDLDQMRKECRGRFGSTQSGIALIT